VYCPIRLIRGIRHPLTTSPAVRRSCTRRDHATVETNLRMELGLWSMWSRRVFVASHSHVSRVARIGLDRALPSPRMTPTHTDRGLEERLTPQDSLGATPRDMRSDSPSPSPRVIGAVWLLYFVTSIIGGLLYQGGLVPGNTAAAFSNIVGHQTQYRAGVAFGLFAHALYVALTALLCGLFARVNRGLSLAAAFFSLVGCVVEIFATILQIAPVTLLRDTALGSVFTADQVKAAALMSLKLWGQTFQMSIPMFALFEVVLGYLIYRSRFAPRFFGVFLMLAGLTWAAYFWPPLLNSVRSVALPFAGLAEISFPVWLVVKGIDVPAWRALEPRSPAAANDHAPSEAIT